jgi:zinc transporter
MPLFLNETASADRGLIDARARPWLLEATFLPAALREVLLEHDDNRRIEPTDDGLLLVVSDFTYEDESDPSEVAPLWCYAGSNLLLTARMHALKSVRSTAQAVFCR